MENRISILMVELESFNNTSTTLRMGNNQKSETCIEQIEVAREKTLRRLNEKYDELVSEVNERKIKIEKKLDDATEKIKEKLQMEETNKRDVANRLQGVKSMKREVTSLMSELHLNRYFEFRATNVSDVDLRSICGSLIQKDFSAQWQSSGKPQTPSDQDVSTTGSPPPKRRRKETASGGKSASKIKITGMNVWCKFLLIYCNKTNDNW